MLSAESITRLINQRSLEWSAQLHSEGLPLTPGGATAAARGTEHAVIDLADPLQLDSTALRLHHGMPPARLLACALDEARSGGAMSRPFYGSGPDLKSRYADEFRVGPIQR
ncbi:hypothetical protein [Streptomyces sp. NPDC048644]|uniref:hypothetical protein n=1 Tax=Streptomyces sp. NPDC048644 TaxID=3365582 RepID=UPI003714D1E2